MLHRTPAQHDANPPSTWVVVKAADRLWHLRQQNHTHPIDSFKTKREAEQARTVGFAARLYEKEGRWFAGEQVAGWKPYEGQNAKGS